MSNDLRRRLARLEARKTGPRPAARALQARHAARMAGLKDFIDTAWPGRSESLAHHVALIMGLPHSTAFRDVLRGEAIEDVAARHHGDCWRENMRNTAADAGRACQRAHGPNWAERFTAIW